MAEQHQAIQFLSVLGKKSVYVRLWQGKGHPEIEKLHKGEDGVERPVRAFKLKADRSPVATDPYKWLPEQWERMVSELQRHNLADFAPQRNFPYRDGGWCPYAVIAEGGHKGADITGFPALFIEFDSPISKAESMAKIRYFAETTGIYPSIIVESRAGYQVYYLLDEQTTVDIWRPLQWRLIEYFESDAGIEDPSRVMRLPGFYHLKLGEAPFMINMIECHPDRKYTVEEFDRVLPAVPDWRIKIERTSQYKPTYINSTGEEWDIREFTEYLTGYKQSARREWDTAKCPVHNGQSNDSLHINRHTGAYVCHHGCTSKEIYEEIVRISGWQRPKGERIVDKTLYKQNKDGFAKAMNITEPAAVKPEKTELSPEDECSAMVAAVDRAAELYGKGTGFFHWALERIATQFKMPRKVMVRIYDQIKFQTNVLQLKSAEEVLAGMDKNQGWLIPDLLPSHWVSLFYGTGGTGKSIFSYSLANAAAKGERFLDYDIPRQVRSIIIQLDEPETQVGVRLQEGQLPIHENIKYLFEFKPGNLPALEKLIVEEDRKLIVIDSLQALQRGSGINIKDPEYGGVLRDLQDVARRTGATFIVLHHTRRDGEFTGNNEILNAVSEMWELRKYSKEKDSSPLLKEERVFDLGGMKTRRLGGGRQILLAYDDNTESFGFVADYAKLKSPDKQPTWVEKVLAVFKQNPGLQKTASQLCDMYQLASLKVNTALKTCKRLMHRGLLMVVGYRELADGGKPEPIYQYVNSENLENQKDNLVDDSIIYTGQDIQRCDNGLTTGVTTVGQVETVLINAEGWDDEPTEVDRTTDVNSDVVLPLSSSCHTAKTIANTEASGDDEELSFRSADFLDNISDELKERFSGSQGKGFMRDRSKLTKPVNPYSGPGVGAKVRFTHVNLTEAQILKLRDSGSEYPWGQSGTVVETGSANNKWFIIVETDNKMRFSVKHLNGIEEI